LLFLDQTCSLAFLGPDDEACSEYTKKQRTDAHEALFAQLKRDYTYTSTLHSLNHLSDLAHHSSAGLILQGFYGHTVVLGLWSIINS
jgi:3-methyladenine DNA glycosylase Mpg